MPLLPLTQNWFPACAKQSSKVYIVPPKNLGGLYATKNSAARGRSNIPYLDPHFHGEGVRVRILNLMNPPSRTRRSTVN